mgnify:CR=1 FL=1
MNIEDAFDELLATLNRNGVTYHLADETLLAKYGRVEGKKLYLGNCIYDKYVFHIFLLSKQF